MIVVWLSLSRWACLLQAGLCCALKVSGVSDPTGKSERIVSCHLRSRKTLDVSSHPISSQSANASTCWAYNCLSCYLFQCEFLVFGRTRRPSSRLRSCHLSPWRLSDGVGPSLGESCERCSSSQNYQPSWSASMEVTLRLYSDRAESWLESPGAAMCSDFDCNWPLIARLWPTLPKCVSKFAIRSVYRAFGRSWLVCSRFEQRVDHRSKHLGACPAETEEHRFTSSSCIDSVTCAFSLRGAAQLWLLPSDYYWSWIL